MDIKQQFEALFNYATIGIVVTDAQGSIINVNNKAAEVFNYTKEEIVGNPVEILLPRSIKKKHAYCREGYYMHPSPRAMGAGRDLFGQKKDGAVFPVEVSLSNYTIDGQIFVIAFIIDITARKNTEAIQLAQKNELESASMEIKQLNANLEKKIETRTKELHQTLTALKQSKEELDEALKAERELGELKSRFVTMASHEFKTPLSTILSSSFLLEKYNNNADASDKRTKHIERIKNAVGEMKSILDDFLSLDRLNKGMIKADMRAISAEDCLTEIKSVINEMQVNFIDGRKINFYKEGNNDLILDKNLLRNICANLLSNAIKFSPENPVIELKAILKKELFELSVKDNGIGISAEDMQHLFEKFFRARNAVNIQGTGLGLHIVSKYLELMNGSIKVESELNAGTIFTIHIPQIMFYEKDTYN